ncbi:hypothetical protein CCUS01_10649 [Colletotrichum cuscutae]|uniref:Uncharacterized protein n=1 Tax=Colletotrichum cuscutae TaxID=1209917 RepID=A0AAI9XKD8_9PEZI|nr:hypothetical protein CCUS01_10649 [Colletotrichum cuscutae]
MRTEPALGWTSRGYLYRVRYLGGNELCLPRSISESTLELHYYRTPSWAQRLVQTTSVVYSTRPNPASTRAKTRCSISSAVNTASINRRRGGNESVDAGSEDRTRVTESTRFRKVGSRRAESYAANGANVAQVVCVWHSMFMELPSLARLHRRNGANARVGTWTHPNLIVRAQVVAQRGQQNLE